jgi:hypothetical protein
MLTDSLRSRVLRLLLFCNPVVEEPERMTVQFSNSHTQELMKLASYNPV